MFRPVCDDKIDLGAVLHRPRQTLLVTCARQMDDLLYAKPLPRGAVAGMGLDMRGLAKLEQSAVAQVKLRMFSQPSRCSEALLLLSESLKEFRKNSPSCPQAVARSQTPYKRSGRLAHGAVWHLPFEDHTFE
ncbi:MAG TPA: hypothetical protein VIT23_03535 [Terrimicrobiaceae bacterium]